MGFMVVWYYGLNCVFQPGPAGWSLFRATELGQAFGSMARHLLVGRFDVDPDAIGSEAFEVGDRIVSYFGIFCALLRLPLQLFAGPRDLDITHASSLIAICLGGWFQLRALLAMRDATAPGPRRDWLTAALVVCILLGGQQIQFSRVSIYQEVVDWANALAMGFVMLAVRGLLHGFNSRTLTGMALFASLALLDRVSFGVGLYAALGGVLLVHWRLGPWPVLVLAAGLVVVGIVNHGRWGNPLVFADFTRYALSQDVTPERIGHIVTYGAFNWRRLGLGLSYYFVPIWMWIGQDGRMLFADTKIAMMDAMELPAGSFLLTDPFLITLSACGVVLGLRPRGEPAGLALLAGLAVPPVLMLLAISMAYRYRLEFYPFFVLSALLGFRALCHRSSRPFGSGVRASIIASVVVSVLASHAMAAIYAVSPWGPAEAYIEKDGWIGTYAPRSRTGHD